MKKIYLLLFIIPFGIFAQVGTLCNNPIIINSLPYTTTDNTANYADNYDPPTATAISCGAGTSGNYYLGGNDVVYSFTPSGTGTIKIEVPTAVAWFGLFVYANCADIGFPPYACNCSSGSGNRTIDNLSVIAGQTYYIVISSWPSPQTVPYTLNVTVISLDNKDLKNNMTVSIYPNPSDKELFFDASFTIEKSRIYNLNGQLISELKVVDNKIIIEELSKGFYIIELDNEEGLTSKHKFIKK